jgi:hypothetical protein
MRREIGIGAAARICSGMVALAVARGFLAGTHGKDGVNSAG